MVNVRFQPQARLNVLLTQDRPHASEHWSEQLPRLLQPQGVAAYVATSASEAIEMVEQLEIHAAVIDLGTPLGERRVATGTAKADGEAGMWLLELMRRMPSRPPVVVINSPVISQNQVNRLLSEALRLGAFSVLQKPVTMEQLLTVFQRLMEREYRGAWPGVNINDVVDRTKPV